MPLGPEILLRPLRDDQLEHGPVIAVVLLDAAERVV